MRRIKNRIKKFKAKKLAKKLDVYITLAMKRRTGAPEGDRQWRSWRDFLNKDEQKEYSSLARKHFELTHSYEYFSTKCDVYIDSAPDSPKGLLTVEYDSSVKVGIWHTTLINDEETTLTLMTYNGELDRPSWVAEEDWAVYRQRFEDAVNG